MRRIKILGYYIKRDRPRQNNGVVYDKKGLCPCITDYSAGGNLVPCIICGKKKQQGHKRNKIIRQLFNLYPYANFKNAHRGRVYSVFGLAPTIHTCMGVEPQIIKLENEWL